MNKAAAIELLGGSVIGAAKAIGITPQAVSAWPETLPPRVADRVQAALWRLQQKAGAEAAAGGQHQEARHAG